MAIQPHNSAHPGDVVAEIGHYLAPEMAQVESTLHEVLDSESTLIREVGAYISLASGKKLRPMMTLLCARAFGPVGTPPPVAVAAAMEAVHVATLLHDDVIDKASLRRGQASVNARWGDDVAILMADFLYTNAFELAMKHLDTDALRLITQVTRRMCEGEMFQIERRGKWLEPEDYMQIISAKTACLFSGCAAMGALAAGLADDAIAAAAAFGMDFGLAFQITDDALDYTGDVEQLGKQPGADLQAGKQTLPLILALQCAPPEERRRLQALLSEGHDHNVIRQVVKQYRTLDQALELANTYARKAGGNLTTLTVRDDVACDFLMALPAYVIARRS
jgi:octaprenyl-diphosphate synthase